MSNIFGSTPSTLLQNLQILIALLRNLGLVEIINFLMAEEKFQEMPLFLVIAQK